MDTEMSYEELEAFLSQDQGEDFGFRNDSVPNAQKQECEKETTNKTKKPKHITKEPVRSDTTSHNRGRKRQIEIPPKSAKTTGSSNRKRSWHDEELTSIEEKTSPSNNSISLLNTRL